MLVTGVNDWYVDGDQLVHIQLLGSSVDVKYNRLAASVNVTNLDNDVAGAGWTVRGPTFQPISRPDPTQTTD